MAKATTKAGGKPVEKKTAVTTVKSGSMAESVPEHMRQDRGKGMGNLDATDYEMPRLKLIQGISDELNTYDGVAAGDFFHTLSESSLGGTLRIVPLYLSKRFILWRPRPPIDQGGIIARADDGVHWVPANKSFEVKVDKRGTKATWTTKNTVAESGLAEWGTYDPSDQESQPAATLCYAIAVALPDHADLSPVMLLLQRASVKSARKLQGKINISAAPPFGMIFNMTSFVDNSPAGDFHNYRFERAGFVEDKVQYEAYRQTSEIFEKMGVKIKDLETAQDEETGTGERKESGSKAAKDEKRY